MLFYDFILMCMGAILGLDKRFLSTKAVCPESMKESADFWCICDKPGYDGLHDNEGRICVFPKIANDTQIVSDCKDIIKEDYLETVDVDIGEMDEIVSSL